MLRSVNIHKTGKFLANSTPINTWKHGRFIIISKLPMTHEEIYLLGCGGAEAVALVRRKIERMCWRIAHS